jgi:hypothetical protein
MSCVQTYTSAVCVIYRAFHLNFVDSIANFLIIRCEAWWLHRLLRSLRLRSWHAWLAASVGYMFASAMCGHCSQQAYVHFHVRHARGAPLVISSLCSGPIRRLVCTILQDKDRGGERLAWFDFQGAPHGLSHAHAFDYCRERIVLFIVLECSETACAFFYPFCRQKTVFAGKNPRNVDDSKGLANVDTWQVPRSRRRGEGRNQ